MKCTLPVIALLALFSGSSVFAQEADPRGIKVVGPGKDACPAGAGSGAWQSRRERPGGALPVTHTRAGGVSECQPLLTNQARSKSR